MRPPAICVCGASGAGKTTVARGLSGIYTTYIEEILENPYVHFLEGRRGDFDAAANQHWFLQRVGRFITEADPKRLLLIDQDPAAVVRVYGRMFYDERRLSETAYNSLQRGLDLVEDSLSQWRTPRLRIFLDASPYVLRERVLARNRFQGAPSLDWFSQVRVYFRTFLAEVSNVIAIPTDGRSLGEVNVLVSKLISEHS